MNTVVERCPNCGVEHEASHVGPCEVCGSELRYWCQRHSREAGWLGGPECPLCLREAEAREAEARRAPPPPAPPPAVPRRLPTTPPASVRPPRRRTRRPMPRVDAREILPHVATGASVVLRLVRAVFVLVRTVFLWALLGAAAGAAYAFLMGGDLIWLVLFGLTNGAVVGLFLGFILAIVSLARRSPS